jgi:hypothetical protein
MRQKYQFFAIEFSVRSPKIMFYIELVFFAFLFYSLGLLFGRHVIPVKYRVAYALTCSVYALVLIFAIDVNLNFPINTSTLKGQSQLAPYWLVIFYLSGQFIMLGAIVSCSKKIFKTET